MLQHTDDLDFAKDTLTTTENTAPFNRRRRLNRRKYDNNALKFDRLRFTETARELDSDFCATEIRGLGVGNNLANKG